jgi:hypothetical protein
VDLNKLTTSDKVIGGSAIALLIFSFLPWYGITADIGIASVSRNRTGWDYFLFGIIPVLLAIAMLVIIVLQRFSSVELPDLPISWAQAFLAAAGLATLLILIRVALTDEAGGIDLDRKFGIFLALLAAIGLVAGAYMKSQEPAEGAGPPPAI